MHSYFFKSPSDFNMYQFVNHCLRQIPRAGSSRLFTKSIIKQIVRDQTTVSRTWVMFTKKRQDMRSSCLANHVTPAIPVTETKNCLYISRHTPLFGALVGFPCVGWDLSPSALEINSLLVFALLWWTCSLGRFGDAGSEHNNLEIKRNSGRTNPIKVKFFSNF